MRRWRKAAAVLMAGALAVAAVSGCAKKQDPKEIYSAAMEKNSALDSVDMDVTMKMAMTADEESMDMEVSSNTKMDQSDKEHVKFITASSVAMDGMNMETTVFYEDGYYYMEAMGQKMKYPMDLESLTVQIQESVGSTTLPVESLDTVEVKKDGDNQILTFTANPEKMNDYLGQVMGAMGDVSQVSGLNMTINSADGEYTIGKDGYYTDMKMNLDLSMESQGASVGMILDITGTVRQPGQPVEITLPDTADYVEIDPALLGAS